MKRFMDKVKPDPNTGCWEWQAFCNPKGYGTFGIGSRRDGSKRKVLAHRFSWELHNGPIPHHASYHGMCVLHHCDNPSCVNPDHLFLGTNKDNVRDMMGKGRQVTKPLIGTNNGSAKLTDEAVERICDDLMGRKTHRQIARAYGVSKSTITRINRGTHWRHIERPTAPPQQGRT